MLNKLVDFSLHNRLIVLLVAGVMMVYGTWTATQMDVDVFPDLTAPTVVVMAEATGLAPEEIERLVVYPIETSVNGATNVRRVRSQSGGGICFVWVEFEWGMDLMQARQVVSEKLQTLSGTFPAGVGTPVLAPQSSIMGEIMMIALQADSAHLQDIRTLADRVLRPRLLAVGGVSQVVVIGGEFKQYQIQAHPLRMAQYNVTLEELAEACAGANANANGGFHREFGNEYIVRGIARTAQLDQLGNTVVKLQNGLPVLIQDVATLTMGPAPRIGDASLNALPAVLLTIQKQPGANTLELTERLNTAVEEMRATLPPYIRLQPKVFQQADFISASVSNVQRSLIEGSIFVVVILLVFLMNLRATAISLIAIPLSLVVAILTLKWLGLTINTMSLGGMAIAIGDLVDDAIIDVENVWKRLRENHKKPPEERTPVLQVVYNASIEIRASVINATFIIICAFLPLFFLDGMEGRMLRPLGIAFIVALFASLVVALTVTPVLCSLLLSKPRQLAKHHAEPWLVRKMKAGYSKALTAAMRRRKALIAGSAVLFIGAVVLLWSQGRSFLPDFNEGSLVITGVAQPGISLEESNRLGIKLEEALARVPEIQLTARRVGRAQLDEHALGVNVTELEAPFTLGERSREAFFEDVRTQLATVPGINTTVGQPIGHRIDHMLSGTRANIAIKIFGPDLQMLFNTGNQILAAIKDVEGVVDASVEPQIEIPQIQIKARREMLARYGITPAEFARFVSIALGSEKMTDIYEGNFTFDVVLRFDVESRASIRNLGDLLIDTHTGMKIPLRYVADIVSTTGPSTINRENLQRKIVVSANVSERDLRAVVEDIQERIGAQVSLSEGYRIEYGGQFESEESASRTLMLASIASLGLIFLILYQEFKTMKDAGIILLNLPFALVGGVVAIALGSGIVSIPAIIGFITLFGIATRNGILLVAQYRHLQDEGLGIYEAIMRGSLDRLSPILMTALTAALALIPLALASDEPGNEIQSPMAKVILGGLLTSTLLNLFVVPVVYFLSHPQRKDEGQ